MKLAPPLSLSVLLTAASLPAHCAEVGPLAPGGAAGLKAAQAEGATPTMWIVGAGALVGVVAAIALSNHGNAIA
ncbi:MAG TPA: hypothetical protein VGM72_14600, partial [Micropepsaceae bacterium]